MSMILMVRAMQTKVGNPLRKLVLIKLADNANDKGECWPSYQHIADQCEISRRSAMEHIDKLEVMGFLRKEFRVGGVKGNKSNLYILLLSGAGDSLGVVQEIHQGGAGDSLGGSAGDSPRTSNSFEPVIEPNNTVKPVSVISNRKEKISYDRDGLKATWNKKAEKHGLPMVRGITSSIDKQIAYLWRAYNKICKQEGNKPKDIDTLICGYIEFGYKPTAWAMGENPEGKKYGIGTALTQKKIDEILSEG